MLEVNYFISKEIKNSQVKNDKHQFSPSENWFYGKLKEKKRGFAEDVIYLHHLEPFSP